MSIFVINNVNCKLKYIKLSNFNEKILISEEIDPSHSGDEVTQISAKQLNDPDFDLVYLNFGEKSEADCELIDVIVDDGKHKIVGVMTGNC